MGLEAGTELIDQNDAGVRVGAVPTTGPLVWIEHIVEGFALVLFVAMILVALFQVVSRFLQISAIWTEELARILFVAAMLPAIAVCVRRREHIFVDYFLEKIRPHRRDKLLAVLDVLIILFLVVWLRGAVRLYELNTGVVYVTVPWIKVSWTFGLEIASILLMILFVLADLFRRWQGRERRARR